jgi:NADH-quinone oxidoreductase subunit J
VPELFDIFFYLFAAATLLSAVVVAVSRNIVHAAVSLLFTFMGVAGIYVLLSADFLAVSQILIYVGGILVLIVFGVMLTNRVTNIDLKRALGARIPALILCVALAALLISFLMQGHWITFNDMPWKRSPWGHDAMAKVTNVQQGTAREILDHNTSEGTSVEIGKLLMTDYLLPFELTSIILLVALLGAVMMVRQDTNGIPRLHGRRWKWFRKQWEGEA